jgi:hypothetical protein
VDNEVYPSYMAIVTVDKSVHNVDIPLYEIF